MAVEQPGFQNGLCLAAADLSTHQYKFVLPTGDFTVNLNTTSGGGCLGVLQNKPKSGAEANVMVDGITKVKLGGTVTAGQHVMSNAAGLGVVLSGANSVSHGVALEGGDSGEVIALQLLRQTSPDVAAQFANGAVVANLGDAAVIGGIPIVFTVAIADASADTDVVMTHKVKILDFWFLNTGIAAHASTDTVTLKNGASAISNAVAKTATVNAVVRAGTLNPANTTINAAGTLRITAAKTTNVAGVAHVLAVRVA